MRSNEYRYSQRNSRAASIVSSTKGVIFLGTPHRGGNHTAWAKIATNMAKFVLKDNNSRVIDALTRGSEVLERLQDSFSGVATSLNIFSFFEEVATSVAGKVCKESRVAVFYCKTNSFRLSTMILLRWVMPMKENNGFPQVTPICASSTLKIASATNESPVPSGNLSMMPTFSLTMVKPLRTLSDYHHRIKPWLLKMLMSRALDPSHWSVLISPIYAKVMLESYNLKTPIRDNEFADSSVHGYRTSCPPLPRPHSSDTSVPDPSVSGSRNPASSDPTKMLSKAGFNLKSKRSRCSALLWVADRWQEEALTLLLDTEIDLETRTDQGMTPLMLAADSGDAGAAKLLLDAGADVEAYSITAEWPLTPLFYAALKGHNRVIEHLLRSGAVEHPHIILCATAKGQLSTMELLLHSANRYALNAALDAVLSCAAYYGYLDIVKLATKAKANIDRVSTVLPIGSLPLADELRIFSVKDQVYLADHTTALIRAIRNGQESVVRFLIEQYADTNIATPASGKTPLMEAVMGGEKTIVQILLTRSIMDINAVDNHGESALWCAVIIGDTATVRLLIDHHAYVDKINKGGGTLVLEAVFTLSRHQDSDDILRMVAQRSRYVNVMHRGHHLTPLQAAAKKGHVTAARILLEAGADKDLVNVNGDSAVTIAEENGCHDLVKLFADWKK